MSKVEREVLLKSEQGLHARPAAIFVQLANKFDCDIVIRKGNEAVNGKSIMGVLMLAAERGSALVVSAEGEDAAKAVEELATFLLTNN
ncbi:MAG TPA: HPr family phosphocarrier protein [Candidatus Omnitrophota bacterium]|nr:HPr family phosphocarrier protein [Candidatus Omnitrophota bacterium]HQL42162.1 HPr family phosphocarrier protein [Candidatus Omnitrophota bacterium]